MSRATRSSHAIRQFGDPVLRQPATEVTTFGESLRVIVADMFAAMEDADGVGLAANQIGLPLAVFVYDCEDDQGRRHRGAVVNPRLVATGGDIVTDEEGCLSLVGVFDPTPRPAWARVEGCDPWGRPIVVEGDGLLGRCLQHEVDHLRGRLYKDLLEAPAAATAAGAAMEGAEMSDQQPGQSAQPGREPSAREQAEVEQRRREAQEASSEAQQSGAAKHGQAPEGYIGADGPAATEADRDADAVRAATEWPLSSEFTDPLQSPLPPRAMPQDENGLPPA